MSCDVQLAVRVDGWNVDGSEPEWSISDAPVGQDDECHFGTNEIHGTSPVSQTPLPVGFRVGALLVPEGVQVGFFDSTLLTSFTFVGPVWFSNLQTAGVFQNGFEFGATVDNYEVFVNTNWSTRRLAMCTQGQLYPLGPVLYTGFRPHSPNCDDFMTSYCASSSDAVCRCFRAQEELKLAYGIQFPVQCADPQCEQDGQDCCFRDGYLTQAMTREGCRVQACQSAIRLEGRDATENMAVTLKCANQTWSYRSVVDIIASSASLTPNPTSIEVEQEDATPWFMWLLLAVGVGLFIFLTVFVAAKYSKSGRGLFGG